MKPATRETLDAMRRVDWARLFQRAGVFIRELRGDAHDAIAADHTRELKRGEDLRLACERFARNALGCVAPDPCECAVCQHTTTEKRS